jgi:hypothetical protein
MRITKQHVPQPVTIELAPEEVAEFISLLFAMNAYLTDMHQMNHRGDKMKREHKLVQKLINGLT